VAYVYDPERTFNQRVNLELVDVASLNGEDSFMLRSLVERHGVETDSPLAARLLEAWETESLEFVKIMPRLYGKILAASRLAEAEGRSVDVAIMEAAANG
jgi:glutamate synthase (NADPH/NADH) large chain